MRLLEVSSIPSVGIYSHSKHGDKVFGTVSHQLHRKRRGAISAFFSKSYVHRKTSTIQSKTESLCKSIEEESESAQVVELHAKFLAFSTDIICAYALEAAPHPELLPDSKAQLDWQKTINAFENTTPVAKQFYQGLPLGLLLPSWCIRPFSPEMSRLKVLHEVSVTS